MSCFTLSLILFCCLIASIITTLVFFFKYQSKILQKNFIIDSLKNDTESFIRTNSELNKEFGDLKIKYEKNLLERQTLEKNYIAIKSSLNSELTILKENYSKLLDDYQIFKKQRDTLIAENSSLKKADEFSKNYQSEFKNFFENVANKNIKQQSIEFTSKSADHLKTLIEPLRTTIEKYEKEHRNNSDYLKESNVVSRKMQEEMISIFNRMFNTLKHDNKIQGNWGETILINILKNFGFKEDRDFFVQQSLPSKRIADVILKIPHYNREDTSIIIDSKVSIKSYDEYINAEDDLKKDFLKKHADSIKNHIKNLAEKEYNSLLNECKTDHNFAPFIIMFVPMEDALNSAIYYNKDIFSFAWKKKIILVSQNQLVMSLFIIRSICDAAKQYANNNNIIYEFRKIYSNLEKFIKDFDKLGNEIMKIQERYHEISKRIINNRKGFGICKSIESLDVSGSDVNILDSSNESLIAINNEQDNNIEDSMKNLKDMGCIDIK
ncbi:DNA recombination protein RmuC [Anaplasmataceae bacterium AB001_6]|nr:DNA recombination protein RmuC [Anaplasmataceae bacterium AB001_6]